MALSTYNRKKENPPCDQPIDYSDTLDTEFSPKELSKLLTISQKQMCLLQNGLYHIMTASYSIVDSRVIFGVSFNTAFLEAISIMNNKAPQFSGDYSNKLDSAGLTPLHVRALSRRSVLQLLTCVRRENDMLFEYREVTQTFLKKYEIYMALHQLMYLRFNFEDAIRLLRHLDLQQIKDLKTNADRLDSAIGWMRDALMAYYETNVYDAMKTITKIILGEPLKDHYLSVARVLRNQFRAIVSAPTAENKLRFMNVTEEEDDIRIQQKRLRGSCELFAVSKSCMRESNFPVLGSENYSGHIACQEMFMPTLFLALGTVGFLCFLIIKSQPIKTLKRRIGFFSTEEDNHAHGNSFSGSDGDLSTRRKSL